MLHTGPPEVQPHEIKCFEKVGGGCFGEVFRGKCRGIEVAVKRLYRTDLDEKTLTDFKKEIEIMSKLNHPNVVLFMGACTTPGHMAIVTELMPKGNLAQLLHNQKIELPLSMRMRMAKDAALGMNWLHESNPSILHRDMKPQNLLIDKDMRVKVCDFGLSVVKPRGEVLRDKDSIPGTPLWMSPEVLQGKDVDEKADVYSYGLVLWEILSRAEPFLHHDNYAMFKRSVCFKNERPPMPENCLPSLRYLIEACWQKEPVKRPSFAQIIPMLDIVVVDATVEDEAGRDLWKKNFLGKDEINWEKFLVALMRALSLPAADPEDIQVRCLKAILGEKSKDPTMHDQWIVTLDRFGKVCDLFGPVLAAPPKRNSNILQNVHDVLRTEWFHGEISREEAESRLTGVVPGTYLVRLSTTSGNCFTISKMSKSGKINHQRIKYSHADGFSITVQSPKGGKGGQTVTSQGSLSLERFIAKIANDLYLKRPLPGPFRSLFVKNTALDGYLFNEEDAEGDFDDDGNASD
jgi:serine/threonine protein kinase